MSKKLITFLSILSLSLSTLLIPANAAAKAGAKCKKAGKVEVVKAKSYTCVKSGKKLAWDRGVTFKKVGTAQPILPTPTPTPTPIRLLQFSSVQSQAINDGYLGNSDKAAVIVRWVIPADSNRIGYRLEISGGGEKITPQCDLLAAACQPSYTQGGTNFSLDLYDPQLEVYKFTDLMSMNTTYTFKVSPLGAKDVNGNPTVGPSRQGFSTTPGYTVPSEPAFSVTGGSKTISFTWSGWSFDSGNNSYYSLRVSIDGAGASVKSFTMTSPGTRNIQANSGTYMVSASGITPSGQSGPTGRAVIIQVTE
jgi:hypothetical protein